jgi:DNA-binding transcriptional regulator LsrR (DeoR family)
MAGLSADRPSEVVLAARVARQFYLEGVSKVDIADQLGISRFRVARLLDSAREAGMVRIEIGLPGGNLDAGLSAELCSAFGLKHAFVFNFPDEDEEALRHRLGEAAGQALMDLITPGDVLGMSWSRTLSGLTASLTQLPPCPIVQLTGAVPPPDGRDLLDLVRGVARVGGGPAHVFYAPMILDDAQTAAAIRRQGDIADAFALLPSVTIAVVALGAWAPGLSTIYDAITPDERDELAALGVRAELAGVFVGADGRPVPTPLDSRMIVTPGPVLERIPFVLSVAYGVAKSPAVCAAIRGRLVHGLVTHASLARAMLSAGPPGGLQPPRAAWWYCKSRAGHPGGRHRRAAGRTLPACDPRAARPPGRGGLRRRPPRPGRWPVDRDSDLHRRPRRGPAAGRGHTHRLGPGEHRRPGAPLSPGRRVLRPVGIPVAAADPGPVPHRPGQPQRRSPGQPGVP